MGYVTDALTELEVWYICLLRRCLHVPECALWPYPGQERAGERPFVASHQEGHDRQAPQADRTGGAKEGEGALSAGAVLRAVFLRGAEHALVRTYGTGSRRANHQADAEDCRQASHGDCGPRLRGGN